MLIFIKEGARFHTRLIPEIHGQLQRNACMTRRPIRVVMISATESK